MITNLQPTDWERLGKEEGTGGAHEYPWEGENNRFYGWTGDGWRLEQEDQGEEGEKKIG